MHGDSADLSLGTRTFRLALHLATTRHAWCRRDAATLNRFVTVGAIRHKRFPPLWTGSASLRLALHLATTRHAWCRRDAATLNRFATAGSIRQLEIPTPHRTPQALHPNLPPLGLCIHMSCCVRPDCKRSLWRLPVAQASSLRASTSPPPAGAGRGRWCAGFQPASRADTPLSHSWRETHATAWQCDSVREHARWDRRSWCVKRLTK